MLNLLPKNQTITLFKRANLTPVQQQSIMQTLQAMPNAKRLMLLSLLMRLLDFAESDKNADSNQSQDITLTDDANTQSFSFSFGDKNKPQWCTISLPYKYYYNGGINYIGGFIVDIVKANINVPATTCTGRGRNQWCTFDHYENHCGIITDLKAEPINDNPVPLTIRQYRYQGFYLEKLPPVKVGEMFCGPGETVANMNSCIFDQIEKGLNRQNNYENPTFLCVFTWLGSLALLSAFAGCAISKLIVAAKAKKEKRRENATENTYLLSEFQVSKLAREPVEATRDDVAIDIELDDTADQASKRQKRWP